MMKRCFDFVFAAIVMILLSPVMLTVAILIWQKMGRPILFLQARSGLHGKPFLMVKFRTMHNAVDVLGESLPDADRLTSLGDLLRSSSLDELPELWNVLKGEMSLVGPRPMLTDYLSLYSSNQARRHEVRPGITGWAQINGRNALSWEEKFARDVWYVDNRCFLLDLKILCATIVRVVRRDGISANGEATMTRFTGGDTLP